MLRPFAADSASPRCGPATKKRGSYNCGRCGLPKKGHVCPSADGPTIVSSHYDHRLRQSLSFENNQADAAGEVADAALAPESEAPEEEADVGRGVLPASCLTEVLRRLSLKELMGASAVCMRWRDCVRRVWSSAEEIRLRMSTLSQIGLLGSVLHKCAGLARLTLRIGSHVDATVLASVAFSCPNLEAFEINVDDNAVNQITGDELGRFITEKRSLSILKIEGCTNLGLLNLYSSSLSTLWLSDLSCISKAVVNCPNLKELSLDFTRQENDTTDLIAMMNSLVRTCPRLRNMHIASLRLCNEAVLALAGANLRGLRMLSLVLGSKITDASVAAIVSCYSSLELLDLSGSSISDSGIGMLCNAFPKSLSRLLLALCPNITSRGIQFATTQLPLLQLIDCGMSIRDLNSQSGNLEDIGLENDKGIEKLKRFPKLPTTKPRLMHQKLIIRHGRLKKLSLWGCLGLSALYLNCPELHDLNLNSCSNLHPEKLLLRCPSLKNVHASGCKDMLIGAIRNQVLNEFADLENYSPYKRLADGSKRVQAPYLFKRQPSDDADKRKRGRSVQCTVHVD